MAYTTIDNPELYFQVKTYTGDGSTSHAITLDGSENMQPDMIWIKCRTGAENHVISDSVRGDSGNASGYYQLHPNTIGQEGSGSGNEYVGAIGSDGFTVGSNDVVNTNNEPYVAWCWVESATAGFDMVTHTGTGSARTISHSLSAVPEVMIVKARNAAEGWAFYHHGMSSAPETDYMYLNNDAGAADYAGFWNDTAPTSSVFSLGDADNTNSASEYNYISYLFSGKQGFSKFGSYTHGNSNADGVFIWC